MELYTEVIRSKYNSDSNMSHCIKGLQKVHNATKHGATLNKTFQSNILNALNSVIASDPISLSKAVMIAYYTGKENGTIRTKNDETITDTIQIYGTELLNHIEGGDCKKFLFTLNRLNFYYHNWAHRPQVEECEKLLNLLSDGLKSYAYVERTTRIMPQKDNINKEILTVYEQLNKLNHFYAIEGLLLKYNLVSSNKSLVKHFWSELDKDETHRSQINLILVAVLKQYRSALDLVGECNCGTHDALLNDCISNKIDSDWITKKQNCMATVLKHKHLSLNEENSLKPFLSTPIYNFYTYYTIIANMINNK